MHSLALAVKYTLGLSWSLYVHLLRCSRIELSPLLHTNCVKMDLCSFTFVPKYFFLYILEFDVLYIYIVAYAIC